MIGINHEEVDITAGVFYRWLISGAMNGIDGMKMLLAMIHKVCRVNSAFITIGLLL